MDDQTKVNGDRANGSAEGVVGSIAGFGNDVATLAELQLRLAALDFTHIIMGHCAPTGREWLATFRGYVHDMVEAVREEVARGATLEEVQRRVTDTLAPIYEKAFSTYGDYRPWRGGLAANIQRTYAMVS